MVYSSSFIQKLLDDVTPEELAKLSVIATQLKPVVQFALKQPVKIIASAIDEDESIVGIFQAIADKTYYNFEIDPDDELSYSLLVKPQRRDSYYADGLLLKKKCKTGIPCGSSCIPKGTVCHIGLPTTGQAKTALVRKLYKASSKVARAAGKVALMAGVGMVAAYAVSKAQSPEGQKKLAAAANAVGLDKDKQDKLRNFASDVAKHSRAPESVVSALKAPPKKPTFNDKVRNATKAYAESWKNAPVKTSMAHLGAGLAAVSGAEALGYLPPNSVMNGVRGAVGKEAMERRTTNFKNRKYNVKSRKPSHGG